MNKNEGYERNILQNFILITQKDSVNYVNYALVECVALKFPLKSMFELNAVSRPNRLKAVFSFKSVTILWRFSLRIYDTANVLLEWKWNGNDPIPDTEVSCEKATEIDTKADLITVDVYVPQLDIYSPH